MKKILLGLFLAGGMLFAENFVNLKLTNKTIMTEAQMQIMYDQPIYARGGYLINEDANNFFYAGIKANGQVIGSDLPVDFSLIVDLVHTKNNSAVPIGIGVKGYLDQFSLPVFLRAEYEYAPEILSFDSADRFSKFQIETGVRFIVNGEVFVGYRNIGFNKNYDSHMYAGIGFVF